MPDKFSKETRSKIMRAIKSTHTKPEIVLRKALFAAGYRYRLHYGKEKIDIAFPSRKIAIFVDGCFWHMCPKHGHIPKSNKKYWGLKKAGWGVIHVWEHELENLEKAFRRIFKRF